MITVREYIKVVLLGEMLTGKTCLVKRYFKDEFNEREETTIAGAFESKIFRIDGREYQMGVWDTSGQERWVSYERLSACGEVLIAARCNARDRVRRQSSEESRSPGQGASLTRFSFAGRFRSVCPVFYRGAAAAVLCYDVRLLQSFRHLGYWISELRRFEPACRIYLCATKADLLDDCQQPNPKLELVRAYAAELNAKFLLTSSKTGLNVDQLFNEILEDCLSEFRHTPSTSTIKLSSGNQLSRKTKRCCSDG